MSAEFPSFHHPPADTLLFGGTIISLDPSGNEGPVEALLVKGGRIAAMGRLADIEAASRPGIRRINLAGRTLLPGFNDAHIHVWKVGHLLTSMLDLRGVASHAELASRLKQRDAALTQPETWLQARGLNEATLAEGHLPTRTHLDAMVPHRPVFIIRTCAHIAMANSRALELAGITRETPDPAGGHIERNASGEPTGILHETALGLISRHIPPPTAAEYRAMIAAAARLLLSQGITSATDPGVMPDLLDVYRALDEESALPLRLNVMAIRRPDGGTSLLPLPARHLSPHLRIDTIKLFADGGLSGATAAMYTPYRTGGQGVLRLTTEEIVEACRDAHLAGFRIAIHAIGDTAIDAVLDAYERLRRLGVRGRHHRIEHFGMPTAEQIARARALGILAIPQAIFLHELGENFLAHLPDDAHIERCYPLRALLDAGIPMALSSDAPVVRCTSPLLGMQAAVLRRTAQGRPLAPTHAISTFEALSAYTLGGAEASGDLANRGTLTPGKWADMTVLDANPLTTPTEELSNIKVEMTFVGGHLAYDESSTLY